MTTSPLVEPDVRIPRIRLSPESRCQERSQGVQPESGKVVVVALIGGGLSPALAAPLEVLGQSVQHVGVDITHRLAGIAQAEVPGPTAQMAVEFGNQLGQWHMAAVKSELLMEHGSFASPCFA